MATVPKTSNISLPSFIPQKEFSIVIIPTYTIFKLRQIFLDLNSKDCNQIYIIEKKIVAMCAWENFLIIVVMCSDPVLTKCTKKCYMYSQTWLSFFFHFFFCHGPYNLLAKAANKPTGLHVPIWSIILMTFISVIH